MSFGTLLGTLVGTLIGSGVSILTTWMMIRAEQRRARRERYMGISMDTLAKLYSQLMAFSRIVDTGTGIFNCGEGDIFLGEGRKAANDFRLEFERKRLFIPSEFESRMDNIVNELSVAYEHIGYRYSSNYEEFHTAAEKQKFEEKAREAMDSVSKGKIAQEIKKLTDDLRNYLQAGKPI